MGLIRLILAFAIVSNHYQNHQLFDFLYASVAVKSFYIISGFYMALILNNNSYVNKKNFYISRFMRLYPIYIVCVIVTFLLGSGYTTSGRNIFSEDLDLIPTFFIIFTNFTMFFQDLTMILGIDGNNLNIVKNFNDSSPYPIFQYLYVPQGWSLGLELTFYLIAPFLLKDIKINKILTLIILSFFIRGFLMSKGFKEDPWNYRFFPNEISLFLFGSISYIFYKKNFFFKDKDLSLICIVFILIFMSSFSYLRIAEKDIIFYLCLIILLPNIFNFSKKIKFDKFLGELSFPVYCCHIFVIHYFVDKVNFVTSNPTGFIETIIGYMIILVFSMSLYFLVQIPVDKIRGNFKLNK
jgi:peptidoglycan/LPS O-acetylase OafA/YrhL